MSDAAVIKRLSARIETLEAELAAERKGREEGFELARQWELGAMRYKAERDELRALLREAADRLPEHVRARIDAALGGDGDA